ncbi:MAG: carbohydrate kinase family protein [Acidimicrobiia bacterium]|nr:carbohydrate kinase family protein [Acidimicrobiia bacterium]
MILVAGDVGWDLFFGVDRFPGPDEKVFTGDTASDVGGVGANTAVAAALLGAEVWFAGRFGGDEFGARAARRLGAYPLNLGLCRVDAATATPLAVIMTDPSGEKRIVLAPTAGMFPDASQVVGAAFPRPDWLHMVAYDPGAATAVAAFLPGVPASLDLEPASIPDGDVSRMQGLVAMMDTVIVNEHSAALFGGADQAVAALQAWGARVVVLTGGAAGAACAVGEQRWVIRPPRVEVVDTTGAGDMFAGAYARARTGGTDAPAAARFAVAAASLSCRGLGPRGAVPTPGEIEQALQTMEGES